MVWDHIFVFFTQTSLAMQTTTGHLYAASKQPLSNAPHMSMPPFLACNYTTELMLSLSDTFYRYACSPPHTAPYGPHPLQPATVPSPPNP